MLLVHEQTFLCTAVGTCRRTVIVSITISQKHRADRMQSFLDRDKPQRLFKRKCTDFIGVEEFHVEFVIFNKRTPSLLKDQQADMIAKPCRFLYAFRIALYYPPSQEWFLFSSSSSSSSSLPLIFVECQCFFLQEQLGLFFFFFMKSCNYRHSLIHRLALRARQMPNIFQF